MAETSWSLIIILLIINIILLIYGKNETKISDSVIWGPDEPPWHLYVGMKVLVYLKVTLFISHCFGFAGQWWFLILKVFK